MSTRRTDAKTGRHIELVVQFDGDIRSSLRSHLGYGTCAAVLWEILRDDDDDEKWKYLDSVRDRVNGLSTIHVATYMGLIRGIDILYRHVRSEIRPRKGDKISLYVESASRLVLSQMCGKWDVCDTNLLRYKNSAHRSLRNIRHVCDRHSTNLYIRYQRVSRKDMADVYKLVRAKATRSRMSRDLELEEGELPPRHIHDNDNDDR
jgi:hypothetical protein